MRTRTMSLEDLNHHSGVLSEESKVSVAWVQERTLGGFEAGEMGTLCSCSNEPSVGREEDCGDGHLCFVVSSMSTTYSIADYSVKSQWSFCE